MTARVPLTWKAHGSTRCVGCGHRFADDPRPITEVEATDYTGGRPGYRANRPVQVMRRWHTDCLQRFEADNQRYREQVEADRRAMAATIQAEIDRRASS